MIDIESLKIFLKSEIHFYRLVVQTIWYFVLTGNNQNPVEFIKLMEKIGYSITKQCRQLRQNSPKV